IRAYMSAGTPPVRPSAIISSSAATTDKAFSSAAATPPQPPRCRQEIPFPSGTLLLRHFTQVGATPQSLTLTGTGNLTYGPSSSFDGNVNSSSPTLFFNGCTFDGTTICTKTGTTGDYSQGGNVFNGVSSITNSGTSFLL